jgi:hypothetical protein
MVLLLACAELLAAQTTSGPPTQTQAQEQGQTSTGNAGQTAEPGQTGAQGGETEEPVAQRSSLAPVPLPLNIDASSLQFSGEEPLKNSLFGGISGEATYDDNLLSQEVSKVGGFAYSVFPSIGVDISRPRLFLDLDYAGGYTFNQRFSAYNQSMQNAKIDLRYRLSPHVRIRIYDRFVLSTGFFDQLQTGVSGLGSGIVQQPNLGVITPLVRHTDENGTVELTYQYSASDMVGASGNVDILTFGAPPAGSANLLNTRTEEGDAFYTHRFTPRNWSGIAYTFQRLTFDPVVETVDTHSIFLFHSIYLQPNTVLAFFAGPEYTELNNQVVSTSITLPFLTVNSVATAQNRWSAAGGASFSWQGKRTSIRANGARKVSDGGGLLAAVDITTGTGAVRRQVARTSALELGVLYASSHALDAGATTSFSKLTTASGSLLWEQHMGRSFMTTLGYARDYQQEIGSTATTLNVNHNRGWVTIGYQFDRPLGR